MTSRRRNQPPRKPESEDNGNVALPEQGKGEDTFTVEGVPELEASVDEAISITVSIPEPTPELKNPPVPKVESIAPEKEKPPKRAERIRRSRNVPKFSMLRGH